MESNPSGLRQLREQHGLKQTAAARKLGTSRGNLWKIENGKHQPKGSLRILLCQLYDITEQQLDELLKAQ